MSRRTSWRVVWQAVPAGLAAGLLSVLLTGFLAASPAGAAPPADPPTHPPTDSGTGSASTPVGEAAREEAADDVARLRQQVELLEAAAELAVEQHTEARQDVTDLAAAELAAQVELDAARERMRSERTDATRRVRELYRTGPGRETLLLAAWRGDDLAALGAGLHAVQGGLAGDAAAVERASRQLDDTVALAAEVERLREATVEAEVLAAARHGSAVTALRAARAALDGADARLVAALEAERRAARAQADAATWQGGPRQPDVTRSALVTAAVDRAPGQAAASAIRYASAQIGLPYQWGAAGPMAFDCSGLTSVAYAQAGVAIPRTSRQQYAALPRVPVAELAPGDLVFYAREQRPDSIHHVGLYLGDGLMVHAPSSGDVVRVAEVDWSRTYGAVRPAA